jgi:ABC-2 type transport system ATP-binding protein
MRLKLGLVLAFIRPFKALLLDEPTSALDTESVQLLLTELVRVRSEGATVLLSTHDPALIEQFGDRRMVMRQGQVEFAG